jgi:hypothetical protein
LLPGAKQSFINKNIALESILLLVLLKLKKAGSEGTTFGKRLNNFYFKLLFHYFCKTSGMISFPR